MRPAIPHLPTPHEEHRGQGCHAGDRVDHRTPGEVEDSPSLQHAASPDHVHHGEIDEGQPDHQEDEIGAEADPVGKSAGDESRGDDGEHHLVGNEGVEGDAGREDVPSGDVH